MAVWISLDKLWISQRRLSSGRFFWQFITIHCSFGRCNDLAWVALAMHVSRCLILYPHIPCLDPHVGCSGPQPLIPLRLRLLQINFYQASVQLKWPKSAGKVGEDCPYVTGEWPHSSTYKAKIRVKLSNHPTMVISRRHIFQRFFLQAAECHL